MDNKAYFNVSQENIDYYDKIWLLEWTESSFIFNQLKENNIGKSLLLLLSNLNSSQVEKVTIQQLLLEDINQLEKLYFTYEFMDKFLFISEKDRNYANIYSLIDTGILTTEELLEALLN